MALEQDYLPYAQAVGANVETQAAWVTDATRTNGQQPGPASSSFNNKALRQANAVVSQFAQYLANNNDADQLDNANPAQMLANITAALQFLPPDINVFTSGTGTFNPKYYFYCAAANATAGAVYNDANNVQFTMVATISGAIIFQASGPAEPALGTGVLTLTKFSGTGDATITYYTIRTPISMRVKMVGAGGGGSSGGGTPGAGVNGTNTTFSTLTAGGGNGAPATAGTPGNGGGVATAVGSGTLKIINALNGATGNGGGFSGGTNSTSGGGGGSSPFGGAGGCRGFNGAGFAAVPNSGSGGGGGSNTSNVNDDGGSGGQAGAFIEALYLAPASSYAWSVGTHGNGGTGGNIGGAGGDGVIGLEIDYQ